MRQMCRIRGFNLKAEGVAELCLAYLCTHITPTTRRDGQVIRPANQLQLSEAELKEEHTRVLTANDPNGGSASLPRTSTVILEPQPSEQIIL